MSCRPEGTHNACDCFLQRQVLYEKALRDIVAHLEVQNKRHVCWYCHAVALDALGGKLFKGLYTKLIAVADIAKNMEISTTGPHNWKGDPKKPTYSVKKKDLEALHKALAEIPGGLV